VIRLCLPFTVDVSDNSAAVSSVDNYFVKAVLFIPFPNHTCGWENPVVKSVFSHRYVKSYLVMKHISMSVKAHAEFSGVTVYNQKQ
jgi:hypothetical protein